MPGASCPLRSTGREFSQAHYLRADCAARTGMSGVPGGQRRITPSRRLGARRRCSERALARQAASPVAPPCFAPFLSALVGHKHRRPGPPAGHAEPRPPTMRAISREGRPSKKSSKRPEIGREQRFFGSERRESNQRSRLGKCPRGFQGGPGKYRTAGQRRGG